MTSANKYVGLSIVADIPLLSERVAGRRYGHTCTGVVQRKINIIIYYRVCDVRGRLGRVNPLITVGAREIRRNGLPVFVDRPGA